MNVLVADDDPIVREIIAAAVAKSRHTPISTSTGTEAWERYLHADIDVVIADWLMPGTDGIELCRKIRKHRETRYTYFILMTGAGKKKELADAFEAGVDDFLTKPVDLDELSIRLKVAARISKLRHSQRQAEETICFLEEQARTRSEWQGMVGRSPAIQEAFRRIRLAAGSDVNVYLAGESGTGKELAARAIHALSSRSQNRFVAFNCGAIPESVLETELFGHARGAFTGAVRDRLGLFQMAQRGTLFLDEIGDISLTLQQKLLRVLQERELFRVGDAEPTRIDVRFVSASNQDLTKLVDEKKLREDFYYRVKVFQIDLPQLRDRSEDIPLLLDHFIDELSTRTGKKVRDISPDALQCLMNHPWRGNIRELRNAMEHAFVTVDGETISLDDLPKEIARSRPFPLDSEKLPRSPAMAPTEEHNRILEALKVSGGNKTQAAKALGISRVSLWKKLKRLGLAQD